MNRLLNRFLSYVKLPTPGNEESETVPTSECQFDLARLLVQEMQEMGIADAHVDEKCYVYGSLPATPGYEKAPAIGFIAHMDTVSEFADHEVRPVLHENYDGGVLELGDSQRRLDPAQFPHLKELKGRTVITTDGTTILGADDKAGIAEILEMAERLLEDKLPHGKICIGFTPDEEVGRGASHFDVEHFGADFAYTLDGDKEGGIEFENFNAASASFDVTGVNVHPGSAKNIMRNAALVAMKIDGLLPKGQTPADTEGYEGFYHLTEMSGDVAHARLSYIVRDHDPEIFEKRLRVLEEINQTINESYGEGTSVLTIRRAYRNMREKIEPHLHLIRNAEKAARMAGIEPFTSPIRGGTDGATLSFMGLPCPNLGTGGHLFHGPMEHISLEGMEKTVEMLLCLVKIYASEDFMK